MTDEMLWVDTGGRRAKYAAEAATHEAGHNLGLNHDGTRKEDEFAVAGFNGGPLRPDDRPLDQPGSVTTAGEPVTGVIERAGDADEFRFQLTDPATVHLVGPRQREPQHGPTEVAFVQLSSVGWARGELNPHVLSDTRT